MNKSTFRRAPRLVLAQLAAIAALASATTMHAQTVVISNMWSIATTEGRPYVQSATDRERGVAYNPINNHAYIVTAQDTLRQIAIVDGNNGTNIGTLSLSGVAGGQFPINQIGVADDGNIYVANLTTGSAGTTVNGPFRIYRWSDELAAPQLVYAGNPSFGPNLRFGDAIDVRGSGMNTEIIASTGGGAATNLVAIFRPIDSTLTVFTNTIVLISGVSITDFAKSVAFGTNDTFYGKNTGSGNLRHCSYSWVEGGLANGSLIRTISVPSTMAGIGVDNTNNLLAGVITANAASPHYMAIYDISVAPPILVYTNGFPPPGTANNNVTAGVDVYGMRIIAVDPRNGVQMAGYLIDTNPVPPSVSAQPAAVIIVQGGYGNISVGATGTKPLAYQWYFEGAEVPSATNATLLLTNLPLSSAGNYLVIITNVAGSATSSPAAVTVIPAASSTALTKMWQKSPGAFPWLLADNNHRGMGYNPFRHHIIVCSRTPAAGLHVLDAETGDYIRSMNMTGVAGGSSGITLNMVACTSEGEVFAANLTTGGVGTPLKIYRWADDDTDTTPTVAWTGDPGNGNNQRWGDNFAMRGAGATAQALLASRSSTVIALIDGMDVVPPFPATVLNVPGVENGAFGLSVAFGEGESFWGKAGGIALRRVEFDINALETVIRNTITNYPSMSSIAYDPANQFVAGIINQTPDNVRLLNVEAPPGTYVELDTEFFQTDNDNVNGTGQMAFGTNRLWTLDSNNGIIGFRVAPKIRRSITGNTMTLTWDGTHTLQASPNVTGGWTNVTGAASGYMTTVTEGARLFYRLVD